MNSHALEHLISQTAALMERHQRLCSQLQHQQAQLAQALQDAAAALPGAVQDSARAATQQLAREGSTVLRTSLQAGTDAYARQMREATEQLGQRRLLLDNELNRLQLASRALLWKCFGTAVVGVAVLLAATVWLGSHYQAELERNQLEVQLLRAINRADVTLCGKEQLCANVDLRTPGQGEHRRYRVVRPRQ